MYGCGIGPVTRESHRSLAAKIINKYVDVITLREPDSLEELRAMGVTEPEVLLTADPALILQKAPDDETDSVLLRAGIPPHGNYLCFALRRWKGFEEKAPLFVAAAKIKKLFFFSQFKHWQAPRASLLQGEEHRLRRSFLSRTRASGDICTGAKLREF